MLTGDDIVAGFEIDLIQQGEDFVRAIAEDQAIGFEIVIGSDRLAQRAGVAVGIAEQLLLRLDKGLGGARRTAQRIFVGRQLDRLGVALDLRLAADIGRDVENTGFRLGLWAVGHGITHGFAPALAFDASCISKKWQSTFWHEALAGNPLRDK